MVFIFGGEGGVKFFGNHEGVGLAKGGVATFFVPHGDLRRLKAGGGA